MRKSKLLESTSFAPTVVKKNKYASPFQSASIFSVIKNAFIVTGLIAAVAFGIGYGGKSLLASYVRGDHVSDLEKSNRAQLFLKLSPIELVEVSADQWDAAVDSMQLGISDKKAILNDIRSPSEKLPSTNTPIKRSDARSKLAWITLWDSDAEDGDVVKIDSGGYSRTVNLTKTPVTFAIPVPKNELINVTGMRDGEGGGITTGISSGGTQVVFPIMSAGQKINLRAVGAK